MNFGEVNNRHRNIRVLYKSANTPNNSSKVSLCPAKDEHAIIKTKKYIEGCGSSKHETFDFLYFGKTQNTLSMINSPIPVMGYKNLNKGLKKLCILVSC